MRIFEVNGIYAYVDGGVEEARKQYGDCWAIFLTEPVLPIISDPTSVDSDGDSVSDAEETMLNGKNPLILDNVRILHNEKYKDEADAAEYLDDVYKVAGSEKLIYYIMEDYYDTSSKINVDLISAKKWMIYCTQLNKYVKKAYSLKIMPADVHYFRNNLNRAPLSYEDLLKEDEEKDRWKLMPVSGSVFHMYGDNGEFNVKFVSNDDYQMFEAVYDKDGNLLTYKNDPHNCSTYNYCGPTDKMSHAMLDVIPYYLYYTVPDIENPYEKVLSKADMVCNLGTSNVLMVIDGVFELTALENILKYCFNEDAHTYRQEVLNNLYTDCILDKNEHQYAKGVRPNENSQKQ